MSVWVYLPAAGAKDSTSSGGGPPGGPPHLLSKTEKTREMPKEDALSRAYGRFLAKNGLFGGTPKNALFWGFLRFWQKIPKTYVLDFFYA